VVVQAACLIGFGVRTMKVLSQLADANHPAVLHHCLPPRTQMHVLAARKRCQAGCSEAAATCYLGACAFARAGPIRAREDPVARALQLSRGV
jgi:hypothetical protein